MKTVLEAGHAGDLVSPFVGSTREIFSAMLSCDCRVIQDFPLAADHPMEMVTATIGLSGHITGALSISFSSETAIQILNRILGIEVEEVDDLVRDAVGELANTIAGKGKRDLAQFELDLGLPQVIVGEDDLLFSPRWAKQYRVAFESEIGNGLLDVGFDLHRSSIR